MNPSLKRLFTLLKWTVLLLSWAFLAYKISSFRYGDLQNLAFHPQYLIPLLLLLPVNWLLEAAKWRYLTAALEKLTLFCALKSVLAGLTTAFLSPNRVGEVIGRPLFFKPANRFSAVLLAGVNGLSQSIAIVACGVPAAFWFFFCVWRQSRWQCYAFVCALVFAAFVVFYFCLPKMAGWLARKNFARRRQRELYIIYNMSAKQLTVALAYSLVRFFVFCLQLWLCLLLCGVRLAPMDAAVAIALNYLCITITPSWAFSEPVVRISYAVLFVGFFSGNVIGIAAAGFILWMVNVALPMLVGSVFLIKFNFWRH